jgi:hypothetical protein
VEVGGKGKEWECEGRGNGREGLGNWYVYSEIFIEKWGSKSGIGSKGYYRRR